jgi:hypothetical protein
VDLPSASLSLAVLSSSPTSQLAEQGDVSTFGEPREQGDVSAIDEPAEQGDVSVIGEPGGTKRRFGDR